MTNTSYPDGDEQSDNVRTFYNVDGSLESRIDQRGIEITYVYDDNRRLQREEASAVGGTVASKGVDDAILSIGRTYDSLGRLEKVTSYELADGSGTIENEVQYEYLSTNGKLRRIYQSHQGAVDTMSTPNTWLGYDAAVDGSNVYTHAVRVQNEVYPLLTNALLQHWYNTDSSIHGRLHRPNYIKLFDGNLITGDVNQTMWYEYNGTGRVARTWTHGGGSLDVDRTMATGTGVYGGWDRFGRTLQQKWFRSTTSHSDVKHGYDYAGNRLWREDVKAAASSQDHDEFYTYDGLQRLTDAQRGSLTGTYPNYTGVTSKNFEQLWTLDQLGNWPEFKQDSDGDGSFLGAIDFDQDRTHNAVNELGTLSGPNQSSWVGPVHDAAGNMTTIARPKSPGLSFVLTYGQIKGGRTL